MTRPQLRVVPADGGESSRDHVITELTNLIPKYQALCNRRGGCRTIQLNLFRPLMAAWDVYGPLWATAADDPWDRVLVQVAIFHSKYTEHVRCGWREHGRAAIAAPAFAPVVAAYPGGAA